jgi:hypothetical protein
VADVDPVRGRFIHHGPARGVPPHDSDQAHRHAQLRQADGLVGTLAAEPFDPFDDRLRTALYGQTCGAQSQVSSNLTEYHDAHAISVPAEHANQPAAAHLGKRSTKVATGWVRCQRTVGGYTACGMPKGGRS